MRLLLNRPGLTKIIAQTISTDMYFSRKMFYLGARARYNLVKLAILFHMIYRKIDMPSEGWGLNFTVDKFRHLRGLPPGPFDIWSFKTGGNKIRYSGSGRWQ